MERSPNFLPWIVGLLLALGLGVMLYSGNQAARIEKATQALDLASRNADSNIFWLTSGSNDESRSEAASTYRREVDTLKEQQQAARLNGQRSASELEYQVAEFKKLNDRYDQEFQLAAARQAFIDDASNSSEAIERSLLQIKANAVASQERLDALDALRLKQQGETTALQFRHSYEISKGIPSWKDDSRRRDEDDALWKRHEQERAELNR